MTCATVSSLAYFCIGLVRAWAATGLPSLNQGTNETNVHVLPQAPLGIDTTSWIGRLYSFYHTVDKLNSSVPATSWSNSGKPLVVRDSELSRA